MATLKLPIVMSNSAKSQTNGSSQSGESDYFDENELANYELMKKDINFHPF